MPNNSDAKKEENSQSSKNIQIPPIPKQTAGAVAGAAAGSIAGPIGAVVGGVVGAVAGKAAETRRPIAPAAKRTVRSVMKSSKAISKTPRRRRPSIRCQTTQNSCALPRKGEKDRIASIDNNKITQRTGNSGTVEVVAGCSETLW
jgi:hypothetical protein